MKKIIAACGINCSECEAREATLANDDEKRKVVAAKWSKSYDADIPYDKVNCTGCMEEGVKFSHCNECEIRQCVKEMELNNCAECEDYPCEELEQFLGYVPEAKKNLEEIRR